MRQTRQFLIMPNADFFQKLKDSSARLAEVFKMNVLWNVRQGSRTTWMAEDAIEFLKIIWIASLIEYAQDEEFAELLGALQYDTHYFDLHWNIALVDDEENVGDVIQGLPRSLLETVCNARSPIIDWAKTLHSSVVEDYINFWLLVFGNLLGWTLPDVERWAARWSDFGQEDSMFFHESPAWYASTVFARRIGDASGENNTRKWVDMAGRIQMILERVGKDSRAGKNIDWAAVAGEIEAASRQI